MITRCKDGSYTIKAIKEQNRLTTVRLKPIDNVAVLPHSKKRTASSLLSGIIVLIIMF